MAHPSRGAAFALLPAERIRIGDRLTGHGRREIPFPSVATVVAKDDAGSGTYRFRLALDGEREDVLLVVPGEHPMDVAAPF